MRMARQNQSLLTCSDECFYATKSVILHGRRRILPRPLPFAARLNVLIGALDTPANRKTLILFLMAVGLAPHMHPDIALQAHYPKER